MNIFLIGTGPMAIDYARVLKAMNKKFEVIGRGEKSASDFENTTGLKCYIGGIEKFVNTNGFPENSYIIIATGTEMLMNSLLLALKAGASKVLIEKPAAISIQELIDNEEQLKPYSESIYIAYNRRFYSSVIETQRLITEDGGLKSMHFEFTEWAHKIEPLTKAPGVKENWFFANSTHVVDLAFYLAGKPIDWKTYSSSGKILWHPKTNFAGAGITDKGVLFSYISNWESAGRWGIELLTEKRRIYLKPLEGIAIQDKGSIQINEHRFDDHLDKNYKPGLFLQVEAFFDHKNFNLKTIKEQINDSKNVYSWILKPNTIL